MSAVDEVAKPVEADAPAQPEEATKAGDSEPVETGAVEEKESSKAEETKPEEPKAEDAALEQAKADQAGEGKKSDMLKTTAKIDPNQRTSHSKYDPGVLPESDDPDEIRKQVEFYFSDGNLPHDKHMWEITGGSENKPVPIKDIAKFKRMRRFQPYSAVVAALKDSKFLEVSGEEGEEVMQRRKPYISNASQERINARSAYVKGFGDEEKDTQFQIEAFFNQFGPYNAVRLRRTEPEKLFKGSVFVEFPDVEALEKFLALDPKPKWKDHDLLIKSKQAYMQEKLGLIRDGQMEPGTRKKFFEGKEGSFRGRGRGRGNKDRNFDKDDWKKRRENDQKNGFRGGRGGRGRGRGRGRDGRDSRRDNKEEDRQALRHSVKPAIQSTDAEGKPVNEDGAKKNGNDTTMDDTKNATANTNGKRAREDDGDAAHPEAKKVDTKTEVSAEAS